ncbi:unnamed protein product, partial [Prorocentrum cordatum]
APRRSAAGSGTPCPPRPSGAARSSSSGPGRAPWASTPPPWGRAGCSSPTGALQRCTPGVGTVSHAQGPSDNTSCLHV